MGRGEIEDPDADLIHNSFEECINDSLIGYCLDIDRDDSGCVIAIPLDDPKPNRITYLGAFLDDTCCAVSECSDQVDNEGAPDGLVDYPDDPDCASYSDNDESIPGEQ